MLVMLVDIKDLKLKPNYNPSSKVNPYFKPNIKHPFLHAHVTTADADR